MAQVLPADSTAVRNASSVVESMTEPILRDKSFDLWRMLSGWEEALFNFSLRVVLAIALFCMGAWAIKHIRNLMTKLLLKRDIEGVAVSLVNSVVVAFLYIALGIGIAGVLGVQSVSFAAVLASMGLAIGMALSGQLQNLAGGVIIVLTKPFTIGNHILSQGVEGTVRAVTLFHTIIVTPENRIIYIPNGALSNNVIVNFNSAGTRRIEWTFGVDYASDVNKALGLLSELAQADERILSEPEHFVAIQSLADSSVNLVVRAWVKSEDYLTVLFAFNKVVFDAFNQAGIDFPFPQITISKREE